jgi:phosphatidylinositol glycan class W
MASSTRARHEAFVSGLGGSSIWEVVLISASGPLLLAVSRLFPLPRSFALEWLLVPFGSLLIVTALSDHAPLAVGLLSLLCAVLFALKPRASAAGETSSANKKNISSSSSLAVSNSQQNNKISFLGDYRAVMMCATTNAILAVDFPVFPRRFAKTESYGWSLMDVGVGSFLFANALVVGARGAAAAAGRSRLRRVGSALPVMLIGLARTLAVKASDYHEHASEYGTHWNFFLTLAVVMVATELVSLPRSLWGWAAVALAAGYQLLLSPWTGLEEWVVGPTRRDSLLSANREGIVSTLGYLSIFYAGAKAGEMARSATPRRWLLILAGCLAGYAALDSLSHLLPASRRLANPTYAAFVVVYNLQQLACFALLSTTVAPPRPGDKDKDLVQATNRSALFTFLLANILTGLTNMSIATIDTKDPLSICILGAYTLAVYGTAQLLHNQGITIKFW